MIGVIHLQGGRVTLQASREGRDFIGASFQAIADADPLWLNDESIREAARQIAAMFVERKIESVPDMRFDA